MSTAEMTVEGPIQPSPQPKSPATGPRVGAWSWVLMACVLLGASGVVRAVQERRHFQEQSYREVCPVDLAKIPTKFGEWQLVKGGEKQLDDLTMRITGGTAHKIRTYVNELTGVGLTVLILFGPADPVSPHTPQVCYPSSGFSEMDAPALRTVGYSAGQDAQGRPIEGKADFLAASYSKSNGRVMLREAVYHSFRLEGRWSPFMPSGRKMPRRNPGIFKIQIQRLASDRESLGKGDPIEQFLGPFLTELESEIKNSTVAKGLPAK